MIRIKYKQLKELSLIAGTRFEIHNFYIKKVINFVPIILKTRFSGIYRKKPYYIPGTKIKNGFSTWLKSMRGGVKNVGFRVVQNPRSWKNDHFQHCF